MTHFQLMQAIKDFYEDTSRSKEDTIDGLQNALEDIQVMIETLESDQEN